MQENRNSTTYRLRLTPKAPSQQARPALGPVGTWSGPLAGQVSEHPRHHTKLCQEPLPTSTSGAGKTRQLHVKRKKSEQLVPHTLYKNKLKMD